MHDTEQRLGHKPRFGTFDAAFDAWYVYAVVINRKEPRILIENDRTER